MTGRGATGPDEPELMTHGYTHRTSRLGAVVTKAYRGPEAVGRCRHETAALRALAGLLPVPPVLAAGPDWLRTALMPGVHGQDLIAAGLAEPVLAACGRMARRIHQLELPAALRPATDEQATFLIHGDFGPNNMLLDAAARAVTAVLDWEWAHAGQPAEDLAWCEFIVRLHHPAEVAALGAFYRAYGSRPPWPVRHAAMLSRCAELAAFCESREPGGSGADAWTQRLAIVRTWTE